MYTRKNGRVTFRSNRRPGFKRNSNFSNGKVRNKGNVTQQYQKYLKFAKEASSAGDRVKSEYYYQFADHYSRLILELGINFDDNENNQSSVDIKPIDKKSDNETKPVEETDINKAEDGLNVSEVEEYSAHGSIESVPFISQPIKKKYTKTKKYSS